MAALYLCKFCVRLTAVKLRTGWGVCRDVGGAGQHPYRPCHSGQRRPGAEQPATSSTLPDPSLHEQDLQHEELLACYPERWGNLVRDICLSE